MVSTTNTAKELELLCQSFEDLVEKECVPSILKNQTQIQELEETVSQKQDILREVRSSLNKKIISYFDLKTSGEADAVTLLQQLLTEEEGELGRLIREKDAMKEEKTKVVSEMSEANSRFERLKKELSDLEKQETEMVEKKTLSPARVTTSMMQTKFQVDSNARCVSLILNNQRRVERITRVDKENTPETELRDSIWSKFYRLYPQSFP